MTTYNKIFDYNNFNIFRLALSITCVSKEAR